MITQAIKISVSWYIALFVVSRSIKKLFSFNFVNIYFSQSIFFANTRFSKTTFHSISILVYFSFYKVFISFLKKWAKSYPVNGVIGGVFSIAFCKLCHLLFSMFCKRKVLLRENKNLLAWKSNIWYDICSNFYIFLISVSSFQLLFNISIGM